MVISRYALKGKIFKGMASNINSGGDLPVVTPIMVCSLEGRRNNVDTNGPFKLVVAILG